MSGMKMDPGIGRFVATHIAEEAPRLKAMSDEQRATYKQEQDAIFDNICRRKGGDPAEVNKSLRNMLEWHPLGKDILASTLFSSSTLRTIMADHGAFYRDWKASRK